MDQFEAGTLNGLPPGLATEESEIVAHDGLDASIDVPFTEVAQRVLDRCEEIAGLVGSKVVTTEHLLLAITSTPESSANKLIQEYRGSSESLLTALQFVLGAHSHDAARGVSATRVERVIIRAKREAYRHNHAEVSTLHLLWAMIREQNGPVSLLSDDAPAARKVAGGPRNSGPVIEAD